MTIISRFYTFVLCAFLWLVLPPSHAPAANWAASMVPVVRGLEASPPRPNLISDYHRFADKDEEFSIVRFDPGSAVLTPTAKRKLDKQTKVLEKFECMTINVTGVADRGEVSTFEESLVLSERRASAVRNYLISKGVSPDRIETIRFGWHSGPVGFNPKYRMAITDEFRIACEIK